MRPIPESYGLSGGRVFAGEYPGHSQPSKAVEKVGALLEFGITDFFDLTEEGELEPYSHLLAGRAGHCRFPIRDLGTVPDERIAELLDVIEHRLQAGGRVYIHCMGGAGRTGTVMGCLFRRFGEDGDAALRRVRDLFGSMPKSKHPRHQCGSPQMPAQIAQVRNWQEPRRASLRLRRSLFPGAPDRFRGCFLGLAVGDAVGTTLEFKPNGSFKPITDMVGGGPFRLKPGEWTDDTSMAWALAASLIAKQGFDAKDQMDRYLAWRHGGEYSSNGTCFDCGITVGRALSFYKKTGEPYAGSTDPDSAGNGSLMRLAPVPIFFEEDAGEAIRLAGESSRTTHATAAAVDACRYFAAILVGALRGETKSRLLEPGYASPEVEFGDLHPEIQRIAHGSWRGRSAEDLPASGYVIHTLEAALWAFATTHDYRSAVLAAVNLGGDADTTGAVVGQLAGAYYGLSAIPEEWMARLARRHELEMVAEGLTYHAGWDPERRIAAEDLAQLLLDEARGDVRDALERVSVMVRESGGGGPMAGPMIMQRARTILEGLQPGLRG